MSNNQNLSKMTHDFAQQLLEEKSLHEYDYTSGNPALYVGTYGKYNDGNLGGMWVDMTTFSDDDEFFDFCRLLHHDEEDPEFMFQDYENMPYSLYNESANPEEIYDIISEIRMKLPNELKQSKWVIEERNKILIDAQREADEIVKNAEDRMVRMIDDNEVTKKAYEQAAAIIDSAKKTSKEMRLGAMEYAEGVLADAEGKLKELKAVVYSESIKTDDYFAQTLNVLAENIQELRMGK